jgi:hypothetical protein
MSDPFLLRVDVDYLEGRVVWPASELPVYPLDALLRIVFGEAKK